MILISFGKSSATILYNKITGNKLASFSGIMGSEMQYKIDERPMTIFMLPHPTSMVVGKSEIYQSVFMKIKSQLSQP